MKKTRRFHPDDEKRIQEARRHTYLLYVEIYCRDSDCPSREAVVKIKDHDHTLIELLERRGGFTCPICGGRTVALHWVQTMNQHDAVDEMHARWSVNRQMRERDQERVDPGGIRFTRASEMCDERLPPTPAGWFSQGQED